MIDFRSLNKGVKIEGFPLPRIDDILTSLGGSKVFSSLDLRSAFHQVKLDAESKELTAFTVNDKKFQFQRLPFGYVNSSKVFQAVMSKALSSSLGKCAFVFLDDILVYSSNYDWHIRDIERLLSNLREAGLKLKLEKCVFFQE